MDDIIIKVCILLVAMTALGLVLVAYSNPPQPCPASTKRHCAIIGKLIICRCRS